MTLSKKVDFRACLRSLAWVLAAAVVAGCAGQLPDEALKRGDKHAMDGNQKKAIAAYSEAIKLDPNCKKAYVCRAMAYNESGEPKKALKDFSKAIELDSRDSYPYEQRASIYRRVFNEEDKAKADEEIAAAIRQKRWSDLQKLRKKR